MTKPDNKVTIEPTSFRLTVEISESEAESVRLDFDSQDDKAMAQQIQYYGNLIVDAIIKAKSS